MKTQREVFLKRIIFALIILVIIPLVGVFIYFAYLYYTLPEDECILETDADGVTYEVCRTIIEETVFLAMQGSIKK